MLLTEEVIAVAKKPIPEPDRVSLINLKGDVEEREFLRKLSVQTGMSVSEIARRGMAMFAVKRGSSRSSLPDNWIAE